MGKITDNAIGFFEQVSSIPGNLLGGAISLGGYGKDALGAAFSLPGKAIGAAIDGASQVILTPIQLANSLGATLKNTTGDIKSIADDFKDVSENAKDTFTSPVFLGVAGLLALMVLKPF